MSETSPLQRQDITPIYRRMDRIIELLEALAKVIVKEREILDKLFGTRGKD